MSVCEMSEVVLVDVLAQVPEAVEDRVEVRHVRAAEPGELAALIAGGWQQVSRARTVVVDAARIPLDRADVVALSRLATVGVRVVIARSTGGLGFAPLLVLHERDFARAAVASIYALGEGQTALLVTPDTDVSALRGLARHALRWRASWQEVEAGSFSSRPALS
ncbi:MAG TPA: hypothetical protein VF669_19080 [Tepidisphaeraceae bacterium]|jgi:hypothetical protein